jgi:hypothetical protein
MTSRDHLEIDKLAKWIVQMVKRGLQKIWFPQGPYSRLGLTTTMASYRV